MMFSLDFTQVLMQDNSSDCGLFVLQYVESLFTVSDHLFSLGLCSIGAMLHSVLMVLSVKRFVLHC